jgi:hypothetical protein
MLSATQSVSPRQARWSIHVSLQIVTVVIVNDSA